HRVARRRDRSRQHPRRLHGAAAKEALRASEPGEDRHGARHRVPADMSRFSLRTRLTILVALAAAITLPVLTVGFNLLLRSNPHADADRGLQARVSAALEGITVQHGTVKVNETPDLGVPDAQVWIYSRGQALERAPGPTSVQRLAD